MNRRRQVPGKRFTVTDIVIILFGVALVISLSVSQWQEKHAAHTAIVQNSTGETITVSLREEQVHHVHGRLGDSLLEVSKGRIRFKDSPCTQRVCIHTGWLKDGGEAAACLPNGISVVLHSESRRYDSINF